MTPIDRGLSGQDTLRSQIARTLLPGFVGTTLPEWLAERLRGGLGGVCLFGINIESMPQLRALTAEIRAANPLAVIAIDEEGGDVTRLYYAVGSPYPGAAVLGRGDDLAHTENVARLVGWELRRAGCTLNFAPSIDINSNADNPVIGVRSFGADPETVAAHGAAWVRGHQQTGVAVSAKHFPGHGDTAVDSHLALPVIDRSAAELRERELVPFRAAIAAGARTIMSSHILLPQLDAERPATFSRTILQGLLREELGFAGVIVTDALDMKGASGEHGIAEAAVLALAAGCDLLCIGTENTDAQLGEIEAAVLAAHEAGRIGSGRIAEAAGRVIRLAEEGLELEASVPIPALVDTEVDPTLAAARVAATFDVSDAAARWLAGGEPGSIVRIDTEANIAVGVAPWGPFAALGTDPGPAWAEQSVQIVAEGGQSPTGLAGRVLVIGKDNHRHAFARAAIDAIRASGAEVLVVDMGWPSDDRAYADIATFGASRLLGRALLELLGAPAAERAA
ncbi:beta-N-acetylhexosaminidase [Microterricola pindariensis]|uniref:Glycoside hydrolase family 3 N-terminal domain-containing protein n=1 Tax=Microterricola pindariensis TaxID=478010 RepID=A0ABX5AUF4_9MICO|nr:beta-N-acetylhexosaminidase [Microterricola pindariensis]PPL15996.1 hypothetical protein GY24_13380 [Microterricola pindariensis]